ncbi:MAG: 4Fe-4S binding protein [Pseudomonadota bacterium]
MGSQHRRILLCDCAGTFAPDGESIEAATGRTSPQIFTDLCGSQQKHLTAAMAEGEVVVACAQMADLFADLAEEAGVKAPLSIDIRDRAGWTDQASLALTGPKQAALIAAASVSAPPTPLMEVTSEGLCLILADTTTGAEAAGALAEPLSVTVLSTDGEAPVDAPAGWDLARGQVRRASGAFGTFTLDVAGYAPLSPAGRGALAFAAPRDGVKTSCDVILDLTGGDPLFPAHEKRDGYLRADPRSPGAVAKAIGEAREMVGSFEKPLHIRVTESLCAHQRAGQTGCTRCLTLCPTGAITVAPGDGVEAISLDPHVCAGCGACAAVCPSGAILYDDPPVEAMFRSLRVMADAWRAAGGDAKVGPPRLLVHDDTHGAEMIRLAARHGDGLPADVIPLETRATAAFGHAEMLVTLALGYSAVTVLAGPKTDVETLGREIDLAEAIAAGAGVPAGRLSVIEPSDPDAMAEALRETVPAPLSLEPILASGGRRDGVRLAAKALAGSEPEAPIALPDGAPYGAVLVNQDSCTLCLSCAGLCPTGALMDNPDRPELSFREEACIQCGICETICPEEAIALQPQLDLSDDVLRPRVLKAEEPFACIECGALFGVKSTVEKIVAKLEGNHALFTNSDNVRLIQMCDDCRVKVQFKSTDNPFAGGQRPLPRTTDDYLKQ